MTTLAKRATPRQARVMRIVAGAVMNAAHAHPDAKLDERFARSVSKRATGTLIAAWPSVLALPAKAASEARGDSAPRPGRPSALADEGGRRSAARLDFAALRRLRIHLGIMAGAARREVVNAELHAALVTALRLLAEASPETKR